MKRQTVDRLFSIGLATTQIVVVIFYGLYFDHILNSSEMARDLKQNLFRYPYFQDSHVMIFVGIGFLITFIHRYRLSCLTVYFWVSALCIQYYFLFNSLWNGVLTEFKRIYISSDRLVLGDFAAAAILIAMCGFVGKVNNFQYLFFTIFGLFVYTLNEAIVFLVLKCRDIGGSMTIHTFAGFYGIAITWVLNYKKSMGSKNIYSKHSSLTSSMFGTLILWCFWPSFNAALAQTEVEMHLVILNTYFSIIGGCIGSYFVSTLIYKGKFQMDQVLNAGLAGGVIIGTSADLIHKGYIAYIIGFLAGSLSSLLFRYMPPILLKFGIHDVAGIFNLHVIPGTLGGMISAIFRKVYIDNEAVAQIAGTFMSVGFGTCGGLLAGTVMRCFAFSQNENEFFNDLETVELEYDVQRKLSGYPANANKINTINQNFTK